MKKLLLIMVLGFVTMHLQAQSFSLPGDGNWYRVATVGGKHGYFEYIYGQYSSNQPSIVSGIGTTNL